VLARTKKKLDEASNTIDLAQTRTNVMTRKLKAVEGLSEPRARALLGVADAPSVSDDADGDAAGLLAAQVLPGWADADEP
jgi:DNA recombination protein RmuC